MGWSAAQVNCSQLLSCSVARTMPVSIQLIMLILVAAATLAMGQYKCHMDIYTEVFVPMLSQFGSTVELHLRSSRDADICLVQFLLTQQASAVRLTTVPHALNSDLKADIIPDAVQHHFYIYESLQVMQNHLRLFINHGGFYILALQNNVWNGEELLEFMEAIWRQLGHNRIYYVQLEVGQILLYNPFLKRDVLAEDAHSFDRIYSNLHGYPLRAYIFDSVYSALFGDGSTQRVLRVTGPDAIAADTVAKHLNFTLNYLWPDDEFFGGRQPNGSYIGGVGRAHRNELDVIFAGFFIKDYLSTRIQFTSAVYMDDLCLFVQKAQRIPQSIVPLFAVRVDVWLCFVLVGLICAFIWICLRCLNVALGIENLERNKLSEERYVFVAWRIFIDTWIVWVRVNVGKFPPYSSERIFLVSLCLVSVIFGALLESSLATAYIRPLYYRDPNTLAELDDSQMAIYIKHPAFKDDLFYGHDSPVYKRLDAKMLLVGEGEDRLISMVAQIGGFAGVTRAASLELNDRRYIMTHKVHKIPECPKTYHIGYVLPKPSPYINSINHVLLHILAGGLLEHWINEMKERAKWNIHQYPEYLAELGVGKWKVLTLKDVQLAFYALAIGCVLAALVWLLECLFK